MRAGPRLPLELAIDAAKVLVEKWRIGEHLVAGSVRRRRPDVGDIELVVPMPPPSERDALYHAIVGTVVTEPPLGMLFEPVGTIGRAVKGLKAGFRYCQLDIKFSGRAGGVRLPVEIYRYEEGPYGNRGWIELMRTGPAEFGEAVLGRWKRLAGIAPEGKGSDKGYLRDRDGKPIPTPVERDVFELVGLEWVEPWDRIDGRSVRPRRGVA